MLVSAALCRDTFMRCDRGCTLALIDRSHSGWIITKKKEDEVLLSPLLTLHHHHHNQQLFCGRTEALPFPLHFEKQIKC